MNSINIKKIVGQVIRSARREKGLSAEDLMKLFHCHKATVSNWEVGKSMPNVMEFLRLVVFLNIDITEIIKVIKVLEGDLK